MWDGVLGEAVRARFDVLARRLNAKGCDAVVISEHQGYQFLYLRASEGPDPRVWRWMDVSVEADNPRVVAASLIDLLETASAERRTAGQVRRLNSRRR